MYLDDVGELQEDGAIKRMSHSHEINNEFGWWTWAKRVNTIKAAVSWGSLTSK